MVIVSFNMIVIHIIHAIKFCGCHRLFSTIFSFDYYFRQILVFKFSFFDATFINTKNTILSGLNQRKSWRKSHIFKMNSCIDRLLPYIYRLKEKSISILKVINSHSKSTFLIYRCVIHHSIPCIIGNNLSSSQHQVICRYDLSYNEHIFLW